MSSSWFAQGLSFLGEWGEFPLGRPFHWLDIRQSLREAAYSQREGEAPSEAGGLAISEKELL